MLIQDTEHKAKVVQHINSIDSANKFTVVHTRPDGVMFCFDIIITPKPVGAPTTGVYKKPRLTDQSLQWDSHIT